MIHNAHVETYRNIEKLARVADAVEKGQVTHTRSRRIGGPVICVYVRDHESPTGVHCLAILDDNAESMAVLRKGTGLSPLSPTEY